MRNLRAPALLLTQVLDRQAPLGSEAAALVEQACGPPIASQMDDCPSAGARGRTLLVLSGWVAEERRLLDGRRQGLRLLIRGDLAGLKGAACQTEIVAMTPAVVCDVTPLRRLVEEGGAPRDLVRAWRGLADVDEARTLRHLMRLGRLTAWERTAQLFLELYDRMAAAGEVRGAVMPMPLTQKQLADHLGLSTVHVNRVLQQLRREGFIELRQRQLVFSNTAKLAEKCFYTPAASPPPPFGRELARAGVL